MAGILLGDRLRACDEHFLVDVERRHVEGLAAASASRRILVFSEARAELDQCRRMCLARDLMRVVVENLPLGVRVR